MEKDKNKEEQKPVIIDTPPTGVAFEELKKEIDALKEQNQSLNELLLQVADKKQLAIYYQRHQAKVPPIVKLRTIEGKVIVGWRTVKDDVYQDSQTMRWVEKQIIEIIFEDGKTQQLALMDYVRLYRHIEAKVMSTLTNTADGKIAFKVQAENGKEYTVGAEYVN